MRLRFFRCRLVICRHGVAPCGLLLRFLVTGHHFMRRCGFILLLRRLRRFLRRAVNAFWFSVNGQLSHALPHRFYWLLRCPTALTQHSVFIFNIPDFLIPHLLHSENL